MEKREKMMRFMADGGKGCALMTADETFATNNLQR